MHIETVSESNYKTSSVVTVSGSCHSIWLVYWTSAVMLYKCVLIVSSFFLAIPTKLYTMAEKDTTGIRGTSPLAF